MIAIQVYRTAVCDRKDYDKKISHGKWYADCNEIVKAVLLRNCTSKNREKYFCFIEMGLVKIS